MKASIEGVDPWLANKLQQKANEPAAEVAEVAEAEPVEEVEPVAEAEPVAEVEPVAAEVEEVEPDDC